jgi:hypothetical protein
MVILFCVRLIYPFLLSYFSQYRIVGSGSGSVPIREGMGRGRMHTLPSWMASDTNSTPPLGKDPTTEAPAASEDKDALIARLLAENAALKKQRATGAATVPVQVYSSSAEPTPTALPPANATLKMPPPKNDLTSHGGGALNLPPPRNATVLNLPPPKAMNLPPPKNDTTSHGGGSNLPLPCNDTVSNLPLPSHGNIHKRKESSATSPAPHPPVTTAIDSDSLNWDDIGVINRYVFLLPHMLLVRYICFYHVQKNLTNKPPWFRCQLVHEQVGRGRFLSSAFCQNFPPQE